jgi:hypothetical protein
MITGCSGAGLEILTPDVKEAVNRAVNKLLHHFRLQQSTFPSLKL